MGGGRATRHILGAFMLLPMVGVTINIMSLFAFMLVLSIVVDDAIIVAESAHAETEKNGYSLKSIVTAQRKSHCRQPLVSPTVAAFLPLLLVTGALGNDSHSRLCGNILLIIFVG